MMMPISFYNFINCSNTLKNSLIDGEKTVVCEGFMKDKEIAILKSEFNCDLKEFKFNGKTIYCIDFKE